MYERRSGRPMARAAHSSTVETLALPLMICSPDRLLEAVGLPSLRSARHTRTAAYIGRKHLDLGCGGNVLKELRPDSHIVGIDVQVERPKFAPSVVGVAEHLPF